MGDSSTLQIYDAVLINIGAGDDDFRPFVGGAHLPPGCHQDTFNNARTSLMAVEGAERLRELDARNATEGGYDYLTPSATKSLYEYFVKPWPADVPPTGTRLMRIEIYRAWTSSVGKIRMQPSAIMSPDKMAKWLVNSKCGNVPTPGTTFERLTHRCNTFFQTLEAEDQVESTLEDCSIADTMLKRLAILQSGDDWKSDFRTNVALPAGPRKARTLSLLLDQLPLDMQDMIFPLEVLSADDVLNADIGSRNVSVNVFWDVVLASLEVWTSTLLQVCPTSSVKILSAGGNQDTVFKAFEKAMKTTNAATLLAHASTSDSSESKAASAGTIVEKQKIIEVATADSTFSDDFRSTCDKAMAQTSDYQAWQTLLQNPDTFRLLCVKIPSTVSNTNAHLAFISKIRAYQFMEMEKDFAAKHGGRFSHAEAAKLVTRALLLDEFFWSGAKPSKHLVMPATLSQNLLTQNCELTGYESRFLLGVAADGTPFPLDGFSAIRVYADERMRLLIKYAPLIFNDEGKDIFLSNIQSLFEMVASRFLAPLAPPAARAPR